MTLNQILEYDRVQCVERSKGSKLKKTQRWIGAGGVRWLSRNSKGLNHRTLGAVLGTISWGRSWWLVPMKLPPNRPRTAPIILWFGPSAQGITATSFLFYPARGLHSGKRMGIGSWRDKLLRRKFEKRQALFASPFVSTASVVWIQTLAQNRVRSHTTLTLFATAVLIDVGLWHWTDIRATHNLL